MDSLEDKITRISLAAMSGAACAAGGFMLGWAKASDVDFQYDDLCKYGPTILTAGAMGAYSGLDTYSEAKKQHLTAERALSITAMSAVSGATTGAFFAAYNTFFFFALGYVAGKISQ